MNAEEYRKLCADVISAELKIHFERIVRMLIDAYPMLEGISVDRFFIYFKKMNN